MVNISSDIEYVIWSYLYDSVRVYDNVGVLGVVTESILYNDITAVYSVPDWFHHETFGGIIGMHKGSKI